MYSVEVEHSRRRAHASFESCSACASAGADNQPYVIMLSASRPLLDEPSEVLHRKKLATQVQATGSTAAQMVRHFRLLAGLQMRVILRRVILRVGAD